MATPTHDVFISYSFKDKLVADQVYQTLLAHGVRPWMAPNDIVPGEEWSSAIIRAIGECRIFALIFSDASNRSDDVLREIRYAASLELPILPYRVQDCPLSPQMEYFIGTSHWLNAYGGAVDDHLAQLVDTISRLLAGRSPTQTRSTAHADALTPPNSPAAPQVGVPNQKSPSIDELLNDPTRLVRTKVGSYILEKPIGAGGTGIVFRARHDTLGSTVCVKLFYPMAAEQIVVSLAMRRGMRGLASLNHPHVIKLHDFGSTNIVGVTLMFLVMELVAGRPLGDWTLQLDSQPNALQRRLQLAYRLANALAAAHSNSYIDEVGFQATGVLHGDIKPANILVRPDDSPVLLDFMMADLQRLLDARWQPADTRDFEPRTWAYGTPGYMAPEQEDQGIVRVTTDVYGLGITLIRVFFPEKFGEVDGRPVWPTALRREEDGLNGLRYLLGQMVHHFSEERPSSMREVSERLEEIARENNCQLS
jgi:hypothetical protein